MLTAWRAAGRLTSNVKIHHRRRKNIRLYRRAASITRGSRLQGAGEEGKGTVANVKGSDLSTDVLSIL